MDGLCEHHPEHTAECGYTEGTPEAPCTHEHTPDCYTQVTECVHEHTPECYPETEDGVSGEQEREPENCAHVCSEESGCITKELNCQHDGECGYSPAVEGRPCTYVCESCNPQGGGEMEPPAPSNGEESTAGEKLQAMPGALSKTMSGTLTIGGIQVADSNVEDVLSDGGSVAYDEDTNTITLTNCNKPDVGIIYNSGQGCTLEIKLIGNNFLKSISAECDCLKITGEGSLKVERDDAGYGIYSSKNLSIEGVDVTVVSTHTSAYGIVAEGDVTIGNGTVTVNSANDALQGYYNVIIENSTINASSKNSNGINSLYGNITISGGSNVTATSAGPSYGCGILATSGEIIINQSEAVAHATAYPGLQGNGGITVTGCKKIDAASVADCGIYSPKDIQVSDSEVTATSENAAAVFTREKLTLERSTVTTQGNYPGLNGSGGIYITDCDEVKASSSNSNGIYSPADIEISNSTVTANGLGPGLQGDVSVTITNGSTVNAEGSASYGILSSDITITSSKVTAEASEDGTSVYTYNDIVVNDSELFTGDDSPWIYIGNQGTISDSWIEGKFNAPENAYQMSDSVIIKEGEGTVSGNAKVPEDVQLTESDTIYIPPNTSLTVGETGKKILGETTVTVENSALTLPAGTVIENTDGTQQTIGTGGGNITLEGEVSDSSTYTVTVENNGNGTASASPTSAAAGEEITLIATPNSGFHFKEWQVTPNSVTINDNKFNMPAENVTVKAIFEKDSSGSTGGSGSSSGSSSSSGSIFSYDGDDDEDDDFSDGSRDSSSTPVYGRETLTSGGVALSGNRVHQSARLTVTKDRLHGSGDCTYCDQIRQWRRQGSVIAIYDVALSRGFRGTVTLTFPVPSQYNGKTLTVVHCLKDKLDTFDVTASGGKVTVTVDSLSPFAILDGSVPDGLNEDEGENPNTGAC